MSNSVQFGRRGGGSVAPQSVKKARKYSPVNEKSRGPAMDERVEAVIDTFSRIPGTWLLMALGILFMGVLMVSESHSHNADIERSLQNILRDPGSLRYRVTNNKEPFITGCFTGKNGFGGYSAWDGFSYDVRFKTLRTGAAYNNC